MWWVGQETSNFYQIFLLIVAFKKLYCRVYCCFCVLTFKLIETIFNNFINSWLLCLHFSNMVNLCPNISFIKYSKCQQFLFWRKSRQKNTNFSFQGALFRNGWLYWYKFWRVLRDFCGFSKKCSNAIFPKLNLKLC